MSDLSEIDAFLAERQRDLRFTGTHWVQWTGRAWKAVDDARLAEMFRQRERPPPQTKRPHAMEPRGRLGQQPR